MMVAVRRVEERVVISGLRKKEAGLRQDVVCFGGWQMWFRGTVSRILMGRGRQFERGSEGETPRQDHLC